MSPQLQRFADKGDQNYGVFGEMTLAQSLELAEKQYGRWNETELGEHKYNHGHQVRSRY